MLWLYHILFTYSSVDGNLRCIHFSAILDKTINICLQVFVWMCVFYWILPQSRTAGSYGKSIFNHLRNWPNCQSDFTISYSHQQRRRVPDSPHLFPYPSGYEMVPHCDTRCPSTYWCFLLFLPTTFCSFQSTPCAWLLQLSLAIGNSALAFTSCLHRALSKSAKVRAEGLLRASLYLCRALSMHTVYTCMWLYGFLGICRSFPKLGWTPHSSTFPFKHLGIPFFLPYYLFPLQAASKLTSR